MTANTDHVRRLIERAGEHPVISLYFDLDPEQFATAPARATQARSLLDDAHNLIEADDSLGHDAQQAARADLARLEEYLGSDDLPVSEARALAIFAASAAGLFETVTLAEPVAPAVFFARAPHVEPLVTQASADRWCAVLVSTRDAEIYLGTGRTLDAHEHSAHYVRGRSQVGGTGRHTEDQDIEGHLIQVAHGLQEDWRARRFTTLLLGGPVEAVAGLEGQLHNDLRPALANERLEVDPSAVTDADLVAAVTDRLHEARERQRTRLLSDYAEQLQAAGAVDRDAPPRAVAGVDHVLRALTEQRVETLLLARDFHAAGARCPQDGMLFGAEVSECPADGTATSPVEDVREPAVAAAIGQDADVVAFADPVDELPPGREIGAILRF